jgi:hypothetical protein
MLPFIPGSGHVIRVVAESIFHAGEKRISYFFGSYYQYDHAGIQTKSG